MAGKQAENRMPQSGAELMEKVDPEALGRELRSQSNEVRRHLLNIRFDSDPDYWTAKQVERMVKSVREHKGDSLEDIALTLGFDNDYSLIRTVGERYRGLLIEMRRNLIKNFGCKTHAEKALVDMAVSGYMRVVRCSEAFTRCLELNDASSNLNQFMANMSKEIDRANRHFISSYQMLLRLKQPPLNVNVKAQAAFVAQNQQINAQRSDAESIDRQ